MKKIAFLIPLSWEYVPAQFFHSFYALQAAALRKYDAHTITSKHVWLDRSRQTLAQEAIKIGADYILWLDADEIYPEETISRLTAEIDSGKDIVCGVTPSKNDGSPVVMKFTGAGVDCEFDKDFKINRGIVQCDITSMAGMMMNPEIFKRLPIDCFTRIGKNEKGNFASEDVSFFWNCREQGLRPWIDTNLHYGHIRQSIVYPLETKEQNG